MIDQILQYKDLTITIVAFVLVYIIVKKLLDRQAKGLRDKKIIHQIILVSLVTIGFIAIILAIPMNNELRSNVTNLMGIVISAVLAISSSTFIGNALAGIMLRFVSSYRPGDMVRVGEHFGKITEQGLFHTEIQTQNSDLTTLPNSFLVANPVKVIRSAGTIIYATISLGYDVPRVKIEKGLIEAALSAGLEKPFVYITNLDDFSVEYKINGFLNDTNKFLNAKSHLYAMVLDKLHEANIEIVSPSFMNQRQVGTQVFIPKTANIEPKVIETLENPEALIFEKADKAESIEKRKETKAELDEKIKNLETDLKKEKDDDKKKSLKIQIEKIKQGREKLNEKIDDIIEDLQKND